MHKPLKRFLILSQVLGLSALAATACTDNNSNTTTATASTQPSNKPAADENKHELTTDQKQDSNYLKPEHTTLKTVGIKAGAGLAKGLVDTAIGAAALAAAKADPKNAEKIYEAAKLVAKEANMGINNKKDKALDKQAKEQEEKDAKKLAEGEESHESLVKKIKDKVHLIYKKDEKTNHPKP